MRISMVSEHASPLAALGGEAAGGQNVHVAALASAAARRGHDVTVHTRREAPDQPTRVETQPGVTVHHVPAGPPTEVPRDNLLPYMEEFGNHLSNCWATEPPDVVHAHFWMSGVAALPAAREHAVPVAQTFHALGSVKRRHLGARDTSPAGRQRLETDIAREVDVIVATCRDEVSELVDLGVPAGKITVVPCGVNLRLFAPTGPVAQRRQRQRLVSIGRLMERKGIDTVIRSLAMLPDVELLVVGGPPPGELDGDAEVRRLRTVADQAGVSNRVEFLGGMPHEEVPPLLRSADIAVCVPWYEPFGIVPLEAMACGVPVVASDVGGHLDTVVAGTTGEHVRPRRPDVLAGVIRRLLDDPERRRKYGSAAAERARSRYSWDRIGAETLVLYEDLCTRRFGWDAVTSGGPR